MDNRDWYAGGQTNLEAIVSPRAHLHVADLVIKGEVCDVDLAGWPEADDGWPEHGTVCLHHGQAPHVLLGVVVSAGM